MVLTDKQKAVTENDFNEKCWNACKIWKEHQSFERFCMAFHNLIKKSKRLGRQSVVKEAADPLPQQQKKAGQFLRSLFVRNSTHNSIRQIVPPISISKSSVHRLVKKKNIHCYKRLNTPQMNSACRKRKAKRAEKLLQRFSIHSLPRLMFQDEKDLSL